MKKLVSLMIVVLIIFTMSAVSFSAAEAAQTIVDVQPGDQVTYSLAISDVPEKVVGCDYSVYYDDSLFEVESVADFTDSTNEDDWQETINYDLPGEVIANFSILKGVNFAQKRNLVTVNLKAKSSGSAHISYYVRYLYPESMEEFTQYTFTCDVTKNGSAVLENAQPELDVSNPQKGAFVNSVTGSSDDANAADTPNNQQNGNNSVNGGDQNENNATTAQQGSTNAQGSSDANNPGSKAATTVGGSQSTVAIETTADGKPVPAKDSTQIPPGVWIALGILLLAGIGVVIFFIVKANKKKPEGPVKDNTIIK